ncbi:MAG: glycosyltransferase family 2 protein [Candidatus Kaelpia imicola]|nr:glycosyltransferase family 2 protein [Candidatus Kaelpia imicola]
MKVSIIIPAHNEEYLIAKILADIVSRTPLEIVEEIIVVDDHSVDTTASVVSKFAQNHTAFNIKAVSNNTPAGFANALRFGIEKARGDLIIHLMADECDRISDISLMFNKFKTSNADIVCGSRYMESGERNGGSVLKGFFSRFVGVSLHSIINIPTRDCSNAFKMYRKKILDKIILNSNGFEVSMELCLKAYLLGYKIDEVSTVWHEREEGSSDFKMFKESSGYIRLYFWAIFKYFQSRMYAVKS